jgi:hypothetical protein
MFIVRYGADDHKNHLKAPGVPRLPCRAKLVPLWFLDGTRTIRGNIASLLLWAHQDGDEGVVDKGLRQYPIH